MAEPRRDAHHRAYHPGEDRRVGFRRLSAAFRIYRVPFSTNVERVALAAAHKGLEVEWVDVDSDDRSLVVGVSGQRLVPVLECDGEIVLDSPVILRWIDERFPDPPLWPRAQPARAEADVFVEWFNLVWKRPPNELADELERPNPDPALVASLGSRIASLNDVFEGLLAGRDYLLRDFGIADVVAYPFLRYAVDRDADDTELFHQVLRDHVSTEGRPRLAAWIDRMGQHPQA